MDSLQPVTKAAVLLEALPYIQRFKGSRFVIKYGGSFMDDPDPRIPQRVLTDLVFLAAVGIEVIVVHGGGKAISRAMEGSGIEPEFRHGLRVTSEAAVQIVHDTLNGKVNPSICEGITARGGFPMGIEGESVFQCVRHLPKDENGEDVDIGFVGDITDVDANRIDRFLKEGCIPVISPVARGEDGKLYNTNADVAAAAVSSALHARRLIYLCDVPGLMADPEDEQSLISTICIDEIEPLKTDGTIGKGMLPKVDSAVKAIHNGVRRVHFVDGRSPHSLLLEIFTNRGIGTEIVPAKDPWRAPPTDDTSITC